MQVTAIGLDLAKNVFQVHGIDAAENVVVRKQLRRGQVMAFFEALAPCLIGMAAREARPGEGRFNIYERQSPGAEPQGFFCCLLITHPWKGRACPRGCGGCPSRTTA